MWINPHKWEALSHPTATGWADEIKEAVFQVQADISLYHDPSISQELSVSFHPEPAAKEIIDHSQPSNPNGKYLFVGVSHCNFELLCSNKKAD
jgi:hypothetical protein